MRFLRLFSSFILLAFVIGTLNFIHLRAAQEEQPRSPQAGHAQISLGLPPVATPLDNPLTPEKIALGRRLYYDPVLSVNNTVACATCHNPAHAFTDGRRLAQGIEKRKAIRNAPTLLNAAFAARYFWDGRAPSLERQAEDPVQNPKEMGNTLQVVEERLNKDASYRTQFEKAFGPGPVTFANVEKAIASFERTLVSAGSPFDRYHYGHDENALSPAARRGLNIFLSKGKGNCGSCHSIDNGYGEFAFPEESGGVGKKKRFVTAAAIGNEQRLAFFTDGKFHNTGVGADRKGHYKDLGRYLVTHKEEDRGAFKTPTLRNIALTGPYMHDGSLKTLKDVIAFYVRGGNPNPHQDPLIHPLRLTKQERADLLVFLESLTGEIPPDSGPPEPATQLRSSK